MAGEIHSIFIQEGIKEAKRRYPTLNILEEKSWLPEEDGLYLWAEGDVSSICKKRMPKKVLLETAKERMMNLGIYGMLEEVEASKALKRQEFYYDVVAAKVTNGKLEKYFAVEFNGQHHYSPVWGNKTFATTIISDTFKSMTNCVER